MIKDVIHSSNQVIEGLKESTGIDLAGLIAGFAGGRLAARPDSEQGQRKDNAEE